MGEAVVWYCRKCRRVLRSDPRGAVKRGCKCDVPRIPSGPTLVSWPDRAQLQEDSDG